MQRAILALGGLVGIGIGLAMLLIPDTFHGSAGIVLDENASLMSEMRAFGGVLVALSLVVLLGSVISQLTFTAAVVASLVYLSYGLSRLLSMAIDGMPSEMLVGATALEILMGLACVGVLMGLRGGRFANDAYQGA